MKPIYHGDNGVHEFWENEDYVILRNHPEREWTAHRKGKDGGLGFLRAFKSDAEAAFELGLTLDVTKKWAGNRVVDRVKNR